MWCVTALPEEGIESSRSHSIRCIEREQHAHGVRTHRKCLIDVEGLARARHDIFRSARNDGVARAVVDLVADKLDARGTRWAPPEPVAPPELVTPAEPPELVVPPTLPPVALEPPVLIIVPPELVVPPLLAAVPRR